MLEGLIHGCDEKMNKSLHALEEHLATIRTGRASTRVFEELEVEAYGVTQPLRNMATIATPDAKTVTIQPWDKGQLGTIERAILAANLGYTPSNDGKLIRIVVPPLTEERRREQVKLAHRMAEEARVAIRNQRRQFNEEIKKIEKKHEVSEDDRDKALKRVQDLTDGHIRTVDKMLQEKEQELMEV
ncbi:MAG: ribosome recycling factor [Candidatus Sumerlaeia bacterium]|nr:ribosome recycling factor [Candidatus Sumerlaeia bacterium]